MTTDLDVLFPVMPYFSLSAPAAGVSLLKAELARAGFSSAIWYLNFDFAERTGWEAYRHLDSHLAGEWALARAAFGEQIPDEAEARAWILADAGQDFARLPSLRREQQNERQRYLTDRLIPYAIDAVATARSLFDDWSRRILDARPRVVGFSTMFGQSGPSLGLAYRLKQLPNAPVVIFGGAGCQGEMGQEMLQRFPWIDYVCIGEGDIAFPAFLEGLLRRGDHSPVPGILKQGESQDLGFAPVVTDLDGLAIPDYTEFFARRLHSPLADQAGPPLVLMEASRGCWWGAKHQCRFCGLGGVEMHYRSKSAERSLDEAEYLMEGNGSRILQFTDNITDIRRIESMFRRLPERIPGVAIHCEIKSNLARHQLASLRAGGVTIAQPGIESFSNRLLRHMSKGCTVAHNICALRWCRELDIEASWLMLYGLPGEPVEEFPKMAARLPLLVHLNPPAACNRITLQRFSPYWREAATCGVTNIRPRFDYRYVFPLAGADPAGLCAHFDYDYTDGRDLDYATPIAEAVEAWVRLWQVPPGRQPHLDLFRTREGVLILDTRPCARRPAYRLAGSAAEIYLACDTAATLPMLARTFAGRMPEDAIKSLLDELTEAGLLWEEEEHYVALALFHNRPQPPAGSG